uniref:RING-type E3 ubiquitin transferase n=1 Tax=Corethrella appendiculata TaxID=1370023 RepID=U5EYD9_9DIPT
MRALGLSLISLSLTIGVIFHAYYQKKQFYPSVVYITKSNASMAVIYIQSLVFVLVLGKLMRKIFLGTLRAAEFEHLMERFWYALTETCLAFTVFRDDFNPKFVALFTVLLFLKSFHWLAEDRVDYMERSPVIRWLFHVRVAGLLLVLGLLDYFLISYAYQSTLTKGATVQLVFGFEYAILITMVINTTIKYILHAIELRSDTPWENKAVFLLYTELIIGLNRVILYVAFVCLMVKIYTLPLFAFRPMYYTMRNFKKALNDVILSRRAIRNMNTLYPNATPEELAQSDNICIICREDMINHSKKLPCGHIFHTACLRSWFQRQQTCPTCRLNILRTPITSTTPPAAAPFNANAQPQNPLQPNTAAGVANDATTATTSTAGVQNLTVPNITAVPLTPGSPLIMPPFPFMTPYAMPLPPAPPSLDTLSEEELLAMEGNERRHIEERIKLLQNIKTLLDASVALMNQYTLVTARLPPTNIVPSSATAAATTTTTTASTTSPTTSNEAGSSSSTTTTNINDVPSTSTSSPSSSSSIINAATLTDQQQSSIPLDKTNDLVKMEDLGSEDDVVPITTKFDSSSSSTTILENNNSATTESSEMCELRRRRLEKFGHQND